MAFLPPGRSPRLLARLESSNRTAFLLGAVACLGLGNILGRFSSSLRWFGLLLVVVSVVLGLLARFAPVGPASPPAWAAATYVSGIALLWVPMERWSVVAALLPAAAMLARRAAVAIGLSLAGLVVTLAAYASQWTWGSAPIDVFREVQGGTGDMLHGLDPYARLYRVGVVIASQWQEIPLHFGYGPGVLVMALPGRVLGDARLSSMVAWLVVAACAARWAPRPERLRTVALLAASPFIPLMVIFSWTDIYGAAAFIGWLTLRQSHRRWALACLGLCLATKPTVGPAVVAIALWSRPARRDLVGGALVAALTCLPFAAWDGPGQFFRSSVGILFDGSALRDRPDGLGLSPLLHSLTGSYLPGSAGLVLTVLCAGAVLLVRPRDAVDSLALGATATTLVILFYKVAFLNYYAVSAVLLAVAVGAAAHPVTSLGEPELPRVLPWGHMRTSLLPVTREGALSQRSESG